MTKEKLYRVIIEREGESFIGYLKSPQLTDNETFTVTNIGPVFEEPEEVLEYANVK